MSAAMDSSTEIVFVRLLGEGTEVMRPVPAAMIPGGYFELLKPDDYDPEYETWEFLPKSRVRCEKRILGAEDILVAVEQITTSDN